ncbi:glycerophosphodiester phosphodiesterase [Aquimarina sp. ERC-38]|uniref:glycerophosphodiester phosphodiesterase n=1 Tax=Aquimarina sp. ERC-38 TaxID=2949996 RepID=UPI0022467066|nr:glycerophosphodiester phosphodiesterase family protein [Aquimarina sp. ERC-38]UZO81507.1 glycerophosphodiester phosphodiesterase [Aquimarina sp. ERC-38]
MKIFGHRGAAGLVDENTLPSIQKALDHGVYGIEIDIHQCKSGELVVIHDDTVDRTTNGKGEVSQLTLAELKALRTENSFQIPTLLEVLKLTAGKGLLNIELKGKGTEQALLTILENQFHLGNWDLKNILISSFELDSLYEIRKLHPSIAIGVLTELEINDVLSEAEALKAVAIHPSVKKLNRNQINKAREEGFYINCWTVLNKEHFDYCKSVGVSAIFTDYPNLFYEV